MSNFYTRNLPHYQPRGGTFFTTFQLVNSIPKYVIARLKQEYKLRIANQKNKNVSKNQKIQKAYFKNFDQFIDKAESGEKWLETDEITQIVADKIHEFDNQKYTLICYCIMPNHVHLIVKMLFEDEKDKSHSMKFPFPLTNTLKLIKGSTAYEANKILDRKGQFWQHESYDHLVRDDDEKARIIRYTLNNPVKAGLVDNWEVWPWNYCKKEFLPFV